MTPILIKYPLDDTGINPNNLVLGELHDLGLTRNRAFVPNYGPYYTESAVLRDAATGQVLVKGTDWKAIQLYQEASVAVGKEICAVFAIINPAVGNQIQVDYQVVGGPFSSSVPALQSMIEALDIDYRAVTWGSIIGKPSAYAPTPHLHDIGDLYGFEYVVEALEGIRTAILLGDVASHDELKQLIALEAAKNDAAFLAVNTALNAHLSDHGNPHVVTQAQVGLGSVQNFGLATTPEAQVGTSNVKYMTPLLVSQAIAQQALIPLNAHITNLSNPHQTTQAQVGLGLVQNLSLSTQPEALAGTVNTSYMTPLRVSQAIAQQALVPLNAHIGNLANPHQVTQAQVGLSAVVNMPLSTQGEAESGTITGSYMTPLRVTQAINAKFPGLFQSYVAAQGDVNAGARNDRWVSPATLAAYVNARLSAYYTAAQVNWLTSQSTYVFTSGQTTAVGYSNIVGSYDDSTNWFDVWPPAGKSMGNLLAFIPSIQSMGYDGVVNRDDSTRCTYVFWGDRIRVWVQNTEQRYVPGANWLAVWR